MKVLFLTPQLPNPPHKGTTIRNFNLIKQLSKNHEIHLLSFIRSEDELPWCDELRRYCRSVETVVAPQHSMLRRLLAFFLTPLPDMAIRLPSSEFMGKLEAILEREAFDIVQVEGIEMAQYGLAIKGYDLASTMLAAAGLPSGTLTGENVAECKVVFDDHNAEYVLQDRAYETDRRYPRRWIKALYSFVQRYKLRRYEAAICQAADHVIAVSQHDAEALQVHRARPAGDRGAQRRGQRLLLLHDPGGGLRPDATLASATWPRWSLPARWTFGPTWTR